MRSLRPRGVFGLPGCPLTALRRLLRHVHRWRATVLAGRLLPYVRPGERILDVGCGDLLLAAALSRRLPELDAVVGLEVMDTRPADPGQGADGAGDPADLPFVRYDGHRLPFADASFDCAYAAFVLHHIADPGQADALLRELLRVSRKRVVLLEDVYRGPLERRLLQLFDLGNLLSRHAMSLPFAFRTESEWIGAAHRAGAVKVEVHPIRPALPKPSRHRAIVLRPAPPSRGVSPDALIPEPSPPRPPSP